MISGEAPRWLRIVGSQLKTMTVITSPKKNMTVIVSAGVARPWVNKSSSFGRLRPSTEPASAAEYAPGENARKKRRRAVRIESRLPTLQRTTRSLDSAAIHPPSGTPATTPAIIDQIPASTPTGSAGRPRSIRRTSPPARSRRSAVRCGVTRQSRKRARNIAGDLAACMAPSPSVDLHPGIGLVGRTAHAAERFVWKPSSAPSRAGGSFRLSCHSNDSIAMLSGWSWMVSS